MRYDAEAQRGLNTGHSFCPEIGDFWQEMFTPVCVVINVDENNVTVLEKTKAADRDHWTWDLDAQPIVYTRTDFAYRWTYGRIGNHAYRGEDARPLANECWCDVMPRHHAWVLDHLKPGVSA